METEVPSPKQILLPSEHKRCNKLSFWEFIPGTLNLHKVDAPNPRTIKLKYLNTNPDNKFSFKVELEEES